MVSTKRKSTASGHDDASPVTKQKRTVPKRTVLKDRSFYADMTLLTFKRFKLSSNIISLLQSLDEVRLGSIQEDDLGRIIRFSPRHQKALLDTISHSTDIMINDASEMGECAMVIKKCTEMISISSKPPATGLPFFKFPRELRDRIYNEFIESQFKTEDKVLRPITYVLTVPPCLSTSCPQSAVSHPSTYIDMNLITTCTRVRDEVLPTLYKDHALSFNCTCTLSDFLIANPIALANVSNLHFHWRGNSSDVAIPILYRCPSLKSVTVFVSKMTTYTSTKRAQEMKKFFKRNTTRLSEALGIDEIIAVRGLEEVVVKNTGKGRAVDKRTQEECWALARILGTYALNDKTCGLWSYFVNGWISHGACMGC